MNAEMIEQVEAMFESAGYSITFESLTESFDSVTDFKRKWGMPDSIGTWTTDPHSDRQLPAIWVWENIQTRRGAARGDLIVIEHPTDEIVTLSYFTGEA